MNRRGFIGALAAAAFALDPDRALWIRGAKLISIPAPRLRVPVRMLDMGWLSWDDEFMVRRFSSINRPLAMQYGVDIHRGGVFDYGSVSQVLADFESVRPQLAAIIGVDPELLVLDDRAAISGMALVGSPARIVGAKLPTVEFV